MSIFWYPDKMIQRFYDHHTIGKQENRKTGKQENRKTGKQENRKTSTN